MSELPLSKSQAIKAIHWLKFNFGAKIQDAIKDTPFSVDIICGIACQETAYRWINWIDNHTSEQVLGLCVFDGTGDVPGTEGNRKAFPSNRAVFEGKYGKGLTDMLVAEGNKMRHAMGWADKPWLYKGFGIFQNDLQNISTDYNFFAYKEWYSFDKCIEKCVGELIKKYAIVKNVPESIRAYNGSGPAAQNYRENVIEFSEYSAQV